GNRGRRREHRHGQRPSVALLGPEHDLDQRSSTGEREETPRSGPGDPARRRGRAVGHPQDRADARQGPRRDQRSRRKRQNHDSFRGTRAQAVRIRAWRERASGRRGFALIALLALAALISAFLIASALNFTSAGNSKEREDRSMSALRQAKAALIAYAASEQWQLYRGEVTTQPGALPCPDILHDGTESEEGDSDCVTPLTSSLIGRLPYKTLGINDLRDASGEQLWYALSANFRKASGTTVINSDTQPCDTPACNPSEIHLTVTGTAPASNVVAVLFAPGEAILGQTRSSNPTDPAHNNPANYLENFSLNVDGIHFTFTTAQPSDTFNDRVLVITQAELIAAVAPVVAARIERDVMPLLVTEYFSKCGVYPLPVPFAAP